MHKNLHTSNHQIKCVKSGNKVHNPKLRNNNFIPNLLKHNTCNIDNFKSIIRHIDSNVCLFTSSIVLIHLRAYVTVFLRKTLRHNWARIYDAYVFNKSIFHCAIILCICIVK